MDTSITQAATPYAVHPTGMLIPDLGIAHEGGFVSAFIASSDGRKAIVISAPAADGDFGDLEWDPSYEGSPGAKSFIDGLANSMAIDNDQHPAAQKARAYRGGGFEDWHLPAHAVQTAILANCCPIWTVLDVFRESGAAAYQKSDYWSSTESQFDSGFAWGQDFGDGYSDYWGKYLELRVRPVRIVLI